MLYSIFTPTHNPKYLTRLAESIKNQKFGYFEWVIVPNGPVTIDDLPNLEDPRIRIVPYVGNTQNIGEIKRFCCQNCKGDILVEVDHDDELTPDCIEVLNEIFQDGGIDFAYSNSCEVFEGKPYTYSEFFGWRYRDFNWKGLELKEAIAFDPTPASFSKIWFAPNHVRAWRKRFYDQIGGHDPNLDVCDDHELLCRTYLHGNVKKIDKCLYIYWYTGENECKGEKNQRIQDLTLAIHDQYIYGLCEKWCDLNGLRKLDLCGGFDAPPGYESIDLHNADIIANLDEPWDFAEDGTVGVIRAHDAIEHLKSSIHTMKEAYRVLAPGGFFLIRVPSTDGRGAWCDPTHVSFFNSWSFKYFTHQQQARYIGTPVRFQMNRIKDYYPSEWHQFHKLAYVQADLMKFEGMDRVPGGYEI